MTQPDGEDQVANPPQSTTDGDGREVPAQGDGTQYGTETPGAERAADDQED